VNKIIGFIADHNVDGVYDLYRKADQVYCAIVCGKEHVISLSASKKNGWTLHTYDSQLKNDWDGVRPNKVKTARKRSLVS
jgi:hypothetical protein